MSAFEYDDIDAWLATYERLKAHGIVPHMVVDHGMTLSMYYLDPDGNSVELQVDNFGDWGRSSAFVRDAPEFAANPIGEFVVDVASGHHRLFTLWSRLIRDAIEDSPPT